VYATVLRPISSRAWQQYANASHIAARHKFGRFETVSDELECLRRNAAKLEKRNEQLQEALRKSEERFFKIFNSSASLMAITSLGEGPIIDINEAGARFSGYRREEIIGRTPAALGLWTNPWQRDLVTQRMLAGGGIRDLEVEIRTKSGQIRAALYSAEKISLKNEICILSIATGITDENRTEEKFKESKEYLNLVINKMGDPIFVKDRMHRFVVVNDALCAFAGKSAEQLIGRTGYERIPGDQAIALWEQEEQIFNTGIECVTEDAVSDGQGRIHTIMARKALLKDKEGSKQIVGVLRDITDYKRLESQLMQAQKMEAVGLLAGGVAHDFNNLLNVISGYSELILENIDQNDSMREDIEQIIDAGRHAASLTSQLLAFSRKQILHPEVLDLNAAVTDMSKMLRRLIGEDVELETITQADLGLTSADPGQIQQIVMNLAVNARDAMPQGGKLTIETKNVDFDDRYVMTHAPVRPGPHVMLAISDNGAGMDAATQARIFEPFFTTKGKGRGTGLGLSTVYGIVKQSDGFIWVYSEPGKGTAFKIYFPRVEGQVSTHTPKDKSEIDLRGFETVLLVEDEEAVRGLVGRILRERGYTVLECADGMDALRKAQEFAGEIHLAITDVVMPGMSGSVLLSQLQALRPGIKALYISGYTDNAIVHHGILLSNVSFLQKPFTVDNLARKVREVISTQPPEFLYPA
jgi:two-component system, cell cycle sensor histidine kinase and response regulator CckA